MLVKTDNKHHHLNPANKKIFSIVIILLCYIYSAFTVASEHVKHPITPHAKHANKHTVQKKKHHSAKHSIAKKCKHHATKHRHTKKTKTPRSFPHLNHHLDATTPTTQMTVNTENTETTSFAGSIEQHLVNFVHSVVSTLHYSSYKLGGTHFDTSRGVYIVDCSDYVNHLLQVIYPSAYSDLLDSMGSDKATSQLYYDFFSNLSENQNPYWSKVEDAEELQPGDILVFRNKNSYGRMGRGHVMVVMDKPIRDTDVLLVRVTDSAPSAHSEDTRQRNDSGIGIGTLLLKVNPATGHLSAYAWKEGSHWESNVNFAMARPLDLNQQESGIMSG